MDKHSKIIIAVLLSVTSVVSLLMLTQIDWHTQGYLGFGLSAAILGLAWALLDFESLLLFILAGLPTIYNFNSFKISLPLNNFLPSYLSADISLNPISLVYLLLLCFFLITLLDFRHNFSNIPLKIVIGLSAAWAALSVLWSDSKAISLIELVYFIIPFIFYFLSYKTFSTPKKFFRLFAVLIASSIVPLLYSFWQLGFGNLYYEADSSLGRLDSTMAHPNSYGLFLAVIIGLALSYYLAKKDRSPRGNMPLIAFVTTAMIALLLTYSRTSWICLAIFILIISIRERFIGRLAVISTPVIIFIILLFDSIRFRLLDIFDNSIFSSVGARTNLWGVTWQKIVEQPVFGYGIGTAEPVIELAKTWQGGASVPHNDFLLQTLELGLFGLFLYCLYTFGAMKLFVETAGRLKDKFSELEAFKQKSFVNLHVLAVGISLTYISLLPATVFESVSQKILIQIIFWSLLGGLLANRKSPA